MARSSFARTDPHSIFARLSPGSRGVVNRRTLSAIALRLWLGIPTYSERDRLVVG